MQTEDLIKYQKLLALAKPYSTLLFDVDGTLADNIWAHKAAYVETALKYNVILDDSLIDETAGWPTVTVAQEIARRYNTPIDPIKFSKEKSKIFIEKYIHQTKSITYVKEVLLHYAGEKSIGIVSGGSRSTLCITLDVIGVQGQYEAMVCAGETKYGKPHPDPFLKCAKLLNASPKECLVFEDGDPGVQAAVAAGMSWVRIDQI